ncbi:putative peptidase DUF31 [Mycoplasma testudineum]|uniref:Putative peptidase DUF31 n=1 Tax=Mycoplasma testudineum TaxID=244584 RepID=A0A4R6IJB0_9MOLU|nr:DUF31 family protein [Mycoplasma testudineum]OYD26425.1 hypothetical protein CG473_04020 [Mycoplasma testudineum]TDO22100.1 putative peptidase DUF31 [Mycoplasma testudineum]
MNKSKKIALVLSSIISISTIAVVASCANKIGIIDPSTDPGLIDDKDIIKKGDGEKDPAKSDINTVDKFVEFWNKQDKNLIVNVDKTAENLNEEMKSISYSSLTDLLKNKSNYFELSNSATVKNIKQELKGNTLLISYQYTQANKELYNLVLTLTGFKDESVKQPENPNPENPKPENPSPENPSPENPKPENPKSEVNFVYSNKVNKQSNFNPITVSKDASTLLSDEEINQRIYDRTFGISIHSTPPDETDIIYNFSQGTAWLLDYAWNSSKTEVMLYLATNAHVYGAAYNSMNSQFNSQFPEYVSTQGNVSAFSLGKATDNVNLNSIPNETNPGSSNDIIYYHNNDKARSVQTSTSSQNNIFVGDDIVSNPKTIFVATNFFDENANNEIIKALQDKGQESDYFIKDFAVFGIKINYQKLVESIKTKSENQKLKNDIDKAISSLDKDILRAKNTKLANHIQGTMPYISVDYLSLARLDKDNIIKNNSEFSNWYSSPRKAFIGGYPVNNGKPFFLHNHPSDGVSFINPGIFNNRSFGSSTSEQIEFFSKKATKIDGAHRIDNSSLYYGASGSMVMNEEGLTMGIYTNLSSRVESAFQTNHYGFIAFLEKSVDEYLLYESMNDGSPVVYAHNLIDGTNKNKYPRQTKSYRQNLKKMASDFDGFTKTALFPNGV